MILPAISDFVIDHPLQLAMPAAGFALQLAVRKMQKEALLRLAFAGSLSLMVVISSVMYLDLREIYASVHTVLNRANERALIIDQMWRDEEMRRGSIPT